VRDFATIRLRTMKSRGCGSRTSILSTAFKVAQSAKQWWQKLRGAEMIAKAITCIQFGSAVEVPKKDRQKKCRLIKSSMTIHDNISRRFAAPRIRPAPSPGTQIEFTIDPRFGNFGNADWFDVNRC
jgi:hypothetical protein